MLDNSEVIRGKNIVLKYNTGTAETPVWELLGGSNKDINITVSREIEKYTDKSVTFAGGVAGGGSWSVSTSGLAIEGEIVTILTLMKGDPTVQIQVGLDNTGTTFFTGDALASNFDYSNPENEASGFSVDLEGSLDYDII